MTPDLSRNAQLVKFFAQQYRGIPRKHLVKLIYMADLLSLEYLGEAISSFHWYRYKHGPYDDAVEVAIQELVDHELASNEREPWWKGSYHRVVDHYKPVPFDFAMGELAVLDYVVRNYLNMSTKELVDDVVYQTEPFKATSQLGERLPMESVKHAGTRHVGFDLADVLRAEQEARDGDFVTLSEFVDELRAKAPA